MLLYIVLQLLFLTLAAAQQPSRTEIKTLYNDRGGCNADGNITLCGEGTSWNSTSGMCNTADVWVCPGTVTVTMMVKDILSGVNSSSPEHLTAVGDTLYFIADGIHGKELWKSDAGTVSVTGGGSSLTDLTDLTAVGDTLYFSAFDQTHGRELWKSDAAGTVMVKNIRVGDWSSYPSQLTAVGDTLYFRADDGIHGYELWKSDAAGTVMVKDIRDGESSSPLQLTAVGNTLYFSANDGINGYELWKSDAAGTAMVGSSSPEHLTAVGDTLYFSANGIHGMDLWKIDAGVLVSITGGGSGDISPEQLTAVGDTLYFSAFDEIHGRELWKSGLVRDTPFKQK